MLVVLVSLGKSHRAHQDGALADRPSHIKGVASHKIVSDGKLIRLGWHSLKQCVV